MIFNFDQVRPILDAQYTEIPWDISSGLSPAELENSVLELEKELAGHTKSYIKSKTFELICRKGQIAVLEADIFQEKLNASGIMIRQRNRWWAETSVHFREEAAEIAAASAAKAYFAYEDFGHTSSDTKALTLLGFSGLIHRLDRAEAELNTPTDEQRDFYESSRIALQAMADFCQRLAEAEGVSAENSEALRQISTGAPRNLYEALQIMIVYFYLQEYIAGTRVRTLGRLDEVFLPFYRKDLCTGTLTRDEAKELWKYFLNKLWTMKVPFDLPFCIGGLDENGGEITNELSSLIVEAYDELNIYSPKIHVRVSPKTPPVFVKQVLRCIRGGNSSFVFVNDTVAIKAMMKCGVPEKEARNYVLIGCYEPAIFDLELPCTGNGRVNLHKAIEYVFLNGRDHATGHLIGAETGEITTYEEFLSAVKTQIAYMIGKGLRYVSTVETYYMNAHPDPILSAMLTPCVEKGMDAYAGGAKYNNSSFYIHSIASLTDSIAAVRKLVFTEKRMTFRELGDILLTDWKGHEKLRLEMLASRDKYGNNLDEIDRIAVEFVSFAAAQINGKPNGRGGIFKAACFTIDSCFPEGAGTMATPDGRHRGDPNSKNLCAVTAMDRNGITALIGTVTKMDHSDFPNGSVLDFVLHPSAVAGEDGLDAFYSILMTYFVKGGFAMHGNVFSADDLKKAQADPEKYSNLQVRVCGWNVYFVNLSKAEQDAFIRQAENAF